MEAFLDPLRETISCIASTRVSASPGGYKRLNTKHALVVNGDRPLHVAPGLQLHLRMAYEIIPLALDDSRGRYRVTTREYDYQLRTDTGETIVSWHWHPTSRVSWTHLHVGHSELPPRRRANRPQPHLDRPDLHRERDPPVHRRSRRHTAAARLGRHLGPA